MCGFYVSLDVTRHQPVGAGVGMQVFITHNIVYLSNATREWNPKEKATFAEVAGVKRLYNITRTL